MAPRKDRKSRSSVRSILWLATALASASISVSEIRADNEPLVTGSTPTFRRLSEDQYKRSIAQTFGQGIAVPGRFEPPVREEGLLAIGQSKVVVTPAGLEQYAIRAREISAQVLSDAHRKEILTCDAPETSAFDEPCARTFLAKYGRLLFRRPLKGGELTSAIGLAQRSTAASNNFRTGLAAGLASLLVSPSFVFRMETLEPAPADPGRTQLDAYSLATRISFLLWDGPPDEELLDAAEKGLLDTPAGLTAQVDRMIASPQIEQGVRAFFSDMFAFDQFEGLSKDSKLFPIFSPQLRNDAREQTLRTIVSHQLTQQKDYRDLFTTKQTFLSRSLGALYGVPVDAEAFGGWMPHTFASDDPHRGLLTFPAFLMLDPSHEGRSSPTIRGKSIRENFLCQPVPLPPADVNFSIVQDVNNPLHKTARDRLTAHQDNPICAGCHSITDPMGLSLENFDAVGRFRTHENGAKIDASGEFEGTPYRSAIELMDLFRTSTDVPSCVVQRAYEYGVGRSAGPDDTRWLEYANTKFAAHGYKFPGLLRLIATSPAFRAGSPPVLTALSSYHRSPGHDSLE